MMNENSIDSISKLQMNESKSLENSIQSLEMAIDFSRKKYTDFKTDKIKELEREYKIKVNNSEYEKAVIFLRKLLFFDSENHIYYSQLANLYIKLYDISSAISCYKKSYFLSKNQNTFKQLENLLFAKGIINLEEGKINKEILKQIKDQMNKNFRAIAFLSVGKKDNAIKELEKILEKEKENVETLLLLGKIYMNMGKYKESSVYLWKVYSINPDHSEIKQYVSIMRLKMNECLDKANENIIKGKTEMGLLWSTKALVMYPNHPEALLLRSAINRKMGKFNESLQDLNQASAHMLTDDNSENVLKQISLTYNELGVNLLKKKNLIEANRFLDEAIKFKSNDLASRYNKGECLFQMKEINKALEQFIICLQIDPKNQEAKSKCALIYYKFAIISFNNKDYEDCITNLERAMKYYPMASEFFVLRARTYMKINCITKAHEDINKSLKLNSNNKIALELKQYITN